MKTLVAILIVLIIAGGTVLWALISERAPVDAYLEISAAEQLLPDDIIRFTVGAESAITKDEAVTVTDAELTKELAALLVGAEPSDPSVGEYLLRLAVNMSGSSETRVYGVWREDNSFLLQDGEDWYILDKSGLLTLLGGLDGLYRYEDHPAAVLETADGKLPLPVAESSYAYVGLNDGLIPVKAPEGDALTVLWEDDYLPFAHFSVEPQGVELILSANGAELFRGSPEEAEAFSLLGGTVYSVEVTARYDKEYYSGDVRYSYILETRALPVRFETRGSLTYPGEAVILRVYNLPEEKNVECATSIQYKPVFYPDGQGGAVALLPVSYYTQPGEYYVEITVGDESERFPITVQHKDFEVQHLTVDAQTTAQTIASQQANAEYNSVIPPLRPVRDATRYWDGRFAYPTNGGSISTPFAVFRYVNGSSTPERHGAIDISLGRGEPVYAPAGGRVLYAGLLQLTGNTILLEHGFGLKTWYYHMDSLNVSTGEMVKQGQKIGEVGSTGFSTGPHLHYGMSVCEVFVNPDTAIDTDLFDFS